MAIALQGGAMCKIGGMQSEFAYLFPSIYKQRRELKISSLLCDSGAIRTLDPRLRRALLYPAELRNQP